MRAQVRTSVQQRDDGSAFGGSPLEDLFYNSNDYQFYCFIDLLRAALFQAFAESIIRGLGQNFHSQKSRDNTPDITEYKDLVSQNKGPFKQDFGGYPYIREMLPTN